MAEKPNVYVDSCVVVSVFAPSPNDTDQARVQRSLWVQSAGQRGLLTLTMSPLAIAEVLGTENVRGSHIPSVDRARQIEDVLRYFRDNELMYVELDQFLSMDAAHLAVAHQLKGPDAVHLASALRAGCSRLYTWDHDLLKLDGNEALGEMRCMEPEPEGQGDLLDELREESTTQDL